MIVDVRWWLIVVATGAATFFFRWIFIHAVGARPLPPQAMHALRYVPAAVLAALVFPSLFRPEGAIEISTDNARLIAGMAAFAVSLFFRSVTVTLVVGMGLLWLLIFLSLHPGVARGQRSGANPAATTLAETELTGNLP